MKWLKRTILTLVLMLLVLAGGLLALPHVVDTGAFKTVLQDRVLQRTGHRLDITGALELRLFPWLAIELGQASLTAPGAREPLARVRSARVAVALLPLLQGDIEADTVTASGLRLHLVRDDQGRGNWEGLTTGGGGSEGGAEPGAALAIGGVELTQAQVDYTDRGAGTTYRIAELDLSTGALEAGRPVAVNAQGRLDAEAEGLKAEFSVAGLVALATADGAIAIRDVDGSVRLLSATAGLAAAQAAIAGDVRILPQGAGVELDARDLSVELETAGEQAHRGEVRLEGRLSYTASPPAVAARDVQGSIRLQRAGAPGPDNGEFSFSGTFSAETGKGRVQGLSARLTAAPVPELSLGPGVGRVSGDLALDLGETLVEGTGLSFQVQAEATQPPLTASLEGDTDLTAHWGSGDVTLADLKARLEGTAAMPGMERFTARIEAGLAYDNALQTLSAEPLMVAVQTEDGRADAPVQRGEATLTGPFALDLGKTTAESALARLEWSVAQPGERLSLAGSVRGAMELALEGPRFSSPDLNAGLEGSNPHWLPKPFALDAQGDLALDLGTGQVTSEKLVVRSAGVTARAAFQASGVPADPAVSGALVIAPFNLRRTLESLGLEAPATQDPEALTRLALESAMAYDDGQLRLPRLTLSVDETRLEGRFAARGTQALELELTGNRFDLDRYLPPPGSGDGSAEGGSALPLWLPSETLTARLSLDALKAFKLRLSQVQLVAEGQNRQVRLAPFTARLYGGRMDHAITLDVTGEVPRTAARLQFDAVRIGDLLADLQGKARLTGTADVSLDVTAQGSEAPALTRTLDGTLDLRVQDGAFKGINVARTIRQARSAISGEPLESGGDLQTDFTALTASARITDGVVRNRDLALKSPLLRIHGEGELDLVRERIDYRTDVALVESTKGQGGRELAELGNITIPLRFSGTFSDPKYSLDPGRLLEQRAKQAIQRELQKKLAPKGGTTQPAPQKPEDVLKQKLLEGLFGR